MVGVDLRCLPADGSDGAGIAHVTRALYQYLLEEGKKKNIQIIGFAVRSAKISRGETIYWLKDARGKNLRQALKTVPLDALFIPSGAVPHGITIPVYPLVHDIAIFHHREWFPQSYIQYLLTTVLFKRGLKQAAHIFSVSEDTKEDLIKTLQIPNKKITVVYQGATEDVLPWNPDPKNLYALVLGSVEPRKNIEFILSWWPELLSQLQKKINLIIAGSASWGKVKMPSVDWIKREDQLTEEKKNSLLQGASIVLIPSKHEGFGRVALEAMSAGVPVMVSDCGALPEVVGEAGVICRLNKDQWIRTVSRVLQDADFAKSLSKKEKERAQQFSWQKTAVEILAKIAQTC